MTDLAVVFSLCFYLVGLVLEPHHAEEKEIVQNVVWCAGDAVDLGALAECSEAKTEKTS